MSGEFLILSGAIIILDLTMWHNDNLWIVCNFSNLICKSLWMFGIEDSNNYIFSVMILSVLFRNVRWLSGLEGSFVPGASECETFLTNSKWFRLQTWHNITCNIRINQISSDRKLEQRWKRNSRAKKKKNSTGKWVARNKNETYLTLAENYPDTYSSYRK